MISPSVQIIVYDTINKIINDHPDLDEVHFRHSYLNTYYNYDVFHRAEFIILLHNNTMIMPSIIDAIYNFMFDLTGNYADTYNTND